MACLLDKAEAPGREQLRDWYREGHHKSGTKRGAKRRSLEVSPCFAPLLRWVVAWSDPASRQLALAMEASPLGPRFTLLLISVVVRGCAIPVAWRLVEATRPGAWRPHWAALFGHVQGSVPSDWTVMVLADRGLYAHWVFTPMQALGWHPFLRSNRPGHYRPHGSPTWRPLTQVVSQIGQQWAGPVYCVRTPAHQLSCPLRARWAPGYHEPWLVLTARPSTHADVAWYGLRAWIEGGGKDSKRGGWHGEQTKMTDPARAERLWLPDLSRLPERHIARRDVARPRPARPVVFGVGGS